MAVNLIQVYDALNTKKFYPISVTPQSLISQICAQIDPLYKKEDKTLYLGELELLADWSIGYLEQHHSLKNNHRLFLLVRTYDLEQTCRILQLEEEEVKELLKEGRVKAFSKNGQLSFRQKDVKLLRDSMMDCPTMMIPAGQQLEKFLSEKEEESLPLRIFDSTSGRSTELGYDGSLTIAELCQQVNSLAEQEDMTLFQRERELDRNRLLSDLVEKKEVDLTTKFVLKYRFYTKEEVLKKLGLNEAKLIQKVQQKELKAFSKKGHWVFKKRDIDEALSSSS